MESNAQGKQKAPALGDATGARNSACDIHPHLQLGLHPTTAPGTCHHSHTRAATSLGVGFSIFQGSCPSPLTFSSSLYTGLMVLRLMVVLRFPCRDLSGRR